MRIALKLSFSALLLFSIFFTWDDTAGAQEERAKKVIYYGWGIRDTQYVRENWRQMEKMPFNGIGIVIAIDRSKPTRGKGATSNQLCWQLMGPRQFRIEDFQEAIADLKVPKWKKFTDNFLPVALSSSVSAIGLNWFDERRWQIIRENFKVLAKIASEGRAKGFILDPEHYNYELFGYVSQRKQVDKPFEHFVETARRRGRELMAAIVESLPDPVILSLYAYTLHLNELRRGNILRKSEYDLLPAFYDGFLESMPARAILIDGYEFAYGFKERRQFLDGYRQIHRDAAKLCKFPDLYREKLRAGFGIWIDYQTQQTYFSPEELQRAVGAALEVSDGYVWIYSQKPQFFPLSEIATSYIEAITEGKRQQVE